MPRGKKTGRAIKSKQQVLTVSKDNLWLLKNFLTRLEKMALVEFYRNRISSILSKYDGEEYIKDAAEEYDIKRYGERIRFIMDHF